MILNINLIKKLPFDIISYIIPFTYKIQNQILLDDIINFHTSKLYILQIYHQIWIINFRNKEPEEKQWFIEDVLMFINNFKNLHLGNDEALYKIFYRNPFINSRNTIKKYIINLRNKNLRNKNIETQINILWGLLFVKERNMFIKNYSIFYL
jgi:hypothetical protein